MEYTLDFRRLDRNTATHELDNTSARILQYADVTRFPGRTVRRKGAAAMQITPSSTTVTSAFVGCRQDCKRIVLDGNTAGTVRLTAGQLSRCVGPLPEWYDLPPFDTDGDPTDYSTVFDYASTVTGAKFSFRWYSTSRIIGWVLNNAWDGLSTYDDRANGSLMAVNSDGTYTEGFSSSQSQGVTGTGSDYTIYGSITAIQDCTYESGGSGPVSITAGSTYYFSTVDPLLIG